MPLPFLRIREDNRPTLASWPKQIFEWEELPACYHDAVRPWVEDGMPLEHILFIPRVHQNKLSQPQWVTAWHKDQVLILTDDGSAPPDIQLLTAADLCYLQRDTRLLACTVTLHLTQGRTVRFGYNKTKEEQVVPVLNLLLGQQPDYLPVPGFQQCAGLAPLEQESFAMFHASKPAYRLGEDAPFYFWARGKQKSRFFRQKEDPEYFAAPLKKGLCLVNTDFYGATVSYLPWAQLAALDADAEQGLSARLQNGETLTLPLLPQQLDRARTFCRQVRSFIRWPRPSK